MRVLRPWVPPIVWSQLRRLGRRAEFTGDYPTWSAAVEMAEGYDAPQILQKVRSATLEVKSGRATFERDSVCFYHEEFRWPLVSVLLDIALQNGGALHVADFGGSLGSAYFQNRKLLKGVHDLRWSIVEQPEYVRVGRNEFEDDTLKFFYTLDECATSRKIDVGVFSGSLQYLDGPMEYIALLSSITPWIVVDRTPFIVASEDRITVHRIPPSIYKGSYAHRFFCVGKFDDFMRELGYVAFAEWEAPDKADIECRYLGRAYNISENVLKSQ